MKLSNALAIALLSLPAHAGGWLFGDFRTEAAAPCLSCGGNATLPFAGLREAVGARAACARVRTNLTFYNADPSSYRSSAERRLEGGATTRYGERLNSVEQAARNGRPVSLAADIYGSFGQTCNRKQSRCTLLVTLPGFDQLYPEYRAKFPFLPANSFLGIVEDTGGAFFHRGTAKLDLAVRRRALANGRAPAGVRPGQTTWRQVGNPCGMGAAARDCDLSHTRISGACF